MCGRYTIIKRPEDIKKLVPFRGDTSRFKARYNVAPTQLAPVITSSMEWTWMQWGLVPSWTKDPAIGSKMINARSETVHEKPSFKRLLKNRRCLVPADGFFEWKKAGNAKQPYYIRLPSGDPFLFAGLWDHWQEPDGGERLTFTILTTEAIAAMQSIHHRMPVILRGDAPALWGSDAVLSETDLKRLCAPPPDDTVTFHPVSTRVNRPVHDAPDCIEPMDSRQAPTSPAESGAMELNFDPPETSG